MAPPVKKSINDEEDELFEKEEMSLDDAIDKLGFGWFQVKLLFIAGMFLLRYYHIIYIC